LIVPIANVLAFAAGTRTSPIDNENLARIFPGNSTGTLSHRLAAALMEGVVSRADFLVDSHSGGVRLAFAPVAGFYDDPSIDPKVAEQSIALAKSMGIAYLWQLPPVTGVLSYEAARRGIPVCGAEIGGRGNCLDADRADYLAAYLSVLAHHGMIAPEHKRLLTTICFEGDWARSAASGYLQTTVTIGDKVNAEAIVGRLLDPLGDIVEELRASHAGTVLGVRHLNTVQPGDLTICIARETIR
jgi:predicted deacylase